MLTRRSSGLAFGQPLTLSVRKRGGFVQEASDSSTLKRIWRQGEIPVVFRRSRPEKLLIKLPDAPGNQRWLQGDKQNYPYWDDQYKAWKVPQAWFEYAIKLCSKRFKKCYVIQLHHELQKCAPACWRAQGIHCECSCMGDNHGTGHPEGRWYEIDETLAVSWGVRKYACRLISAK